MESMLRVNIPVQMISCTDTNGKITPIKFRFWDKNGELITITIDKVMSDDQDQNCMGINFSCAAEIYGCRKIFKLWYSYYVHEWLLSRLQV